MTNVQHLEIELEAIEAVLDFLRDQVDTYEQQQTQVQMKLNRARRLERELQDAKQNG